MWISCSFLRIWSHLLGKSLMENFIFCAVYLSSVETNRSDLHGNQLISKQIISNLVATPSLLTPSLFWYLFLSFEYCFIKMTFSF